VPKLPQAQVPTVCKATFRMVEIIFSNFDLIWKFIFAIMLIVGFFIISSNRW
jgi:hypothetical protein